MIALNSVECGHLHDTNEHTDAKKSYCAIHKDQEIVFACYQCQKMCCHKCENHHKGHTKAFFKDKFIYSNYDNVEQIDPETLQEKPPIQLQI